MDDDPLSSELIAAREELEEWRIGPTEARTSQRKELHSSQPRIPSAIQANITVFLPPRRSQHFTEKLDAYKSAWVSSSIAMSFSLLAQLQD